MIKSIFKEIIIVLLLIIVIILLLGILFYDYMPNSKNVPAKVQEYALAEDVKTEINKELDNFNSEEIIKTYQLDATAIEIYEETKDYNKGKVNPFAKYSQETTGNNLNNANNNSNNIGTNSSTGGTFLNTVGK